jgi:hypothetical protein
MATKTDHRVNLYWKDPTTKDKLRAAAASTNHRSISAMSEYIIHQYLAEHPELLGKRNLLGA